VAIHRRARTAPPQSPVEGGRGHDVGDAERDQAVSLGNAHDASAVRGIWVRIAALSGPVSGTDSHEAPLDWSWDDAVMTQITAVGSDLPIDPFEVALDEAIAELPAPFRSQLD